MILEFIPLWEQNKGRLEEYFKTTPQSEYDSYEKLVKLIFERVINQGLSDSIYPHNVSFDTKRLHVIDDGEYQGSLLFLIPTDCYQPDVGNYVLTFVDYGSCSGCDALLAISHYDSGLPTDEQVEDYMTLCLHLFQNMRKLKEG